MAWDNSFVRLGTNFAAFLIAVTLISIFKAHQGPFGGCLTERVIKACQDGGKMTENTSSHNHGHCRTSVNFKKVTLCLLFVKKNVFLTKDTACYARKTK